MAKPQIGEEEIQAVEAVLRSGMLAQGSQVEAFEKAFADYVGVRHAIAVSSGTTALHLALLALGIGEGDEVITTPFSFIATANAIRYVGATPVFADIDLATFNISPSLVEKAITERTRAILVVHLYGLAANMPQIMRIAREHDLLVIEDAAQAHGAAINGRMVGDFGDAACFSFYPTKNMTTGEGGMITTDRDGMADRARLLRQHGMRVRYHHEMLGYNFRMTDIGAAIGLAQLPKLNWFNRRRIENAFHLSSRLESRRRYVIPFVPEGYRHVFHQYTIRLPKGVDREEARERLKEAGFGSEVYYPIPIHMQETFLGEKGEGLFPVSEGAARQVLSLPIHPAVEREDLDRLAEVILSF